MDHEPNLRSEHSEVRAFVLFRNTTVRVVDVYWVNYSSKLIHYTTLQPRAECTVNTYVTHPWVFKDKQSDERMCVGHQPVYMPEPWYISSYSAGRLIRKEVNIHFPVRTLKENCLWRIVSLLADAEGSALWELEIPRMLIQELAVRKRNKARKT
ncbi:protein Vhl [Anopheles moucheti]|uniref:protein Vhl n=1 Tax=Anopheles moucheti TaxID=186751 RepID=UPI0022F0FE9F|nr:protein Vhl [Anopheles moucheti]